MAKKTSAESDEAKLKKRVRERIGGSQNPEGDAALRSLHKRLKRTQRKRRRLEIRKRYAMGGKAGSAAKTEAKAPPSGA